MLKFVNTSSTGIKQRFGRYVRLVKPGLRIYIPFIEQITLISNMQKQEKFRHTVKTKNDVFATINVAVQYRINPDDTDKAYFSMMDPVKQIEAYIQSSIGSNVPKMEFNGLYESQDKISELISGTLKQNMQSKGYTIENVIITSIEPAVVVSDAMNKVYASERLKQAAANEADANYIRVVKEGEAQREWKKLQGEGTAKQRIELLKGYEKGVVDMSQKLDISPQDVMNYVLAVQKLEVDHHIGTSNNTKILFLDTSKQPVNLISALTSVQ